MDPKEIPETPSSTPTTINETTVRVLGDGRVPTRGVRRPRELIHHLSLSVAQTQLLSNDHSGCVPGPAPFPTSLDRGQSFPQRLHNSSCTPLDEAMLDLDEAEKATHICDPWQLEELISDYASHPSVADFKAEIGMNHCRDLWWFYLPYRVGHEYCRTPNLTIRVSSGAHRLRRCLSPSPVEASSTVAPPPSLRLRESI